MTHWGWYWKYRKEHTPKRPCSDFGLCEIDSFDMYKNRELIELVRNSPDRRSFEVPRYKLKATLLAGSDSLRVDYERGSYIIPVERMPCNYGGYYYFFRCPQCKTRMRKLYCLEGRYLCRKCANLGYLTQRLRPSRRCLAMARKIKDKLEGMAGSLERKPPWMKQRTFKKLKSRHFEYSVIKWDKASRRELVTYYPSMKYELDCW